MMRSMGYFLGRGLGESKVGISELIDPYVQVRNCASLGLKGKEVGSFVTVSPDSSLNGFFIKEGEDFPYCGFQEPWMNLEGQKVQGLEIFFE